MSTDQLKRDFVNLLTSAREHPLRVDFSASLSRRVKFSVFLKEKGISEEVFFRMCFNYVLKQESAMIGLIEKMQKELKFYSRKERIVLQEEEVEKKVNENLFLDKCDIENIFDILEEDYPKL